MAGRYRGCALAVVLAASFAAVVTPASANSADFGITVDAPSDVKVGGHVTYKLSVTNSGPQAGPPVIRFTRGHGATTTEQGSSLHTISERGSQGTCNNDGKGVICRPGGMAPGETATITIVLEVFKDDLPKLALQATVAPELPTEDSDPNKANDHVDIDSKIVAPITVDGLPKGCISKTVTLKIETAVGGKARTKAIVDGRVLGNTQHPKLAVKVDPHRLSHGNHTLSIVVQAAKGPPIATLKRKFKRC